MLRRMLSLAERRPLRGIDGIAATCGAGCNQPSSMVSTRGGEVERLRVLIVCFKDRILEKRRARPWVGCVPVGPPRG
jgi:hypothetical protein